MRSLAASTALPTVLSIKAGRPQVTQLHWCSVPWREALAGECSRKVFSFVKRRYGQHCIPQGAVLSIVCPGLCCGHVATWLFGLNQDGIPSMRKNLHVATEPEEARQAALRLRALGLEPPRAHLFKKLAEAESARSSRKEQAGPCKGEIQMDVFVPVLLQDIPSSRMLSPQLRELCLSLLLFASC